MMRKELDAKNIELEASKARIEEMEVQMELKKAKNRDAMCMDITNALANNLAVKCAIDLTSVNDNGEVVSSFTEIAELEAVKLKEEELINTKLELAEANEWQVRLLALILLMSGVVLMG